MKEKEWVNTIIPEVEQSLQNDSDNLKVVAGKKLPYSNEILLYSGNQPDQRLPLMMPSHTVRKHKLTNMRINIFKT